MNLFEANGIAMQVRSPFACLFVDVVCGLRAAPPTGLLLQWLGRQAKVDIKLEIGGACQGEKIATRGEPTPIIYRSIFAARWSLSAFQ